MITIERMYRPDCTLGILTLDDFKCWTLELPNLDNRKDISCIPEGVYEYFARESGRNGTVLELKAILIQGLSMSLIRL